MFAIDDIGADWLFRKVDEIPEKIKRLTPVEFNEKNRYLPKSVTRYPGFMDFSVNPPMEEIVNCFDVDHPCTELALMKGVQITYTTGLECGIFYYMAHIKVDSIMYVTADKELATLRVENNIIPMLKHSKFDHIIRSADEGNKRKTGKNKDQIQFEGGGTFYPNGAQNANKARQTSVRVMIMDERDAWPLIIGKDGDPGELFKSRTDSFEETRKIFEGSTPLIKGTSAIYKSYKRGDQRVYKILCKVCNYPQELRWETIDEDTGLVGGFMWETNEGLLVPGSVRYCCQKCGVEHFEYDKEKIFSKAEGAKWVPTKKPDMPNVRSYKYPALLSPYGMQSWEKCVDKYLAGYDPETRRVKDIGKFQVFYNNILAEPFEVRGSKITFTSVSNHRRSIYRFGEIPNEYAAQYSGSKILIVTCQVDVHKDFLAVTVMGWCRGSKPYVIEYFSLRPREDEDDCTQLNCSVWGRLGKILEEAIYEADDGEKYKIAFTWVDANWATDTVTKFCSQYDRGVITIQGRPRPRTNTAIKEFSEFKTQQGTIGYLITVDHYKDRLAPVLRREWFEELGIQDDFHFNAPVDITDKQLKELTKEDRREKISPEGVVTYVWHRPGNARNELWDLLVYGHAGIEIIAHNLCIKEFEMEAVDWPAFWDFLERDRWYFYDEAA